MKAKSNFAPWGEQAVAMAKETGKPFDECRDAIILEWMGKGNFLPLAHAFHLGYAPGAGVLRAFADMLHPRYWKRYKNENGEDVILVPPYRLIPRKTLQRRGRHSQPSLRTRNQEIAKRVDAVRLTAAEAGEKITKTEAFEQVAEEVFGSVGAYENVRKIYYEAKSSAPRGAKKRVTKSPN